MLLDTEPANFPLRLEGACEGKKLLPISARVHEKVSAIPAIDVNFYCENAKLKLEDIVGQTMHLVAESEDKTKKRWFRGICVSAEFVSSLDVGGLFKAEVRPWLWMLTRRTNLRIFQELSVTDIIESVLGDHGYSGNVEKKLSGTYKPREYCVQYRETDLDFLNRLMEEEGIYYYFDHSATTEKMVLIDDSGKHEDVEAPSKLDFRPFRMRSTNETGVPMVFEWSGSEELRSGKVTLDDYNFDNSTAALSTESNKTGKYFANEDERYDYPGHFREAGRGDQYARVLMEAEAAPHHVVTGFSDAIHLAVGRRLEVDNLPRQSDPKTVMLLECVHEIVQVEAFHDGALLGDKDLAPAFGIQTDPLEPHMVHFTAMDAQVQYRAPRLTPWPKIGGIHTAVVTGKSGEEIYTDKYGRIKVQFHWDRGGKKDETSSCWVRTMMPWTGKNWGAIAVPRVGQEVVISFEEGDPDRPMCIGMLYNDKTMPPYALPDNKTQSGVKTDSTKGGGGYNELMFEDKKGSELVRMHAQKDYDLTVKNDATEVIETGNHSRTVEKGDMTVDVNLGKIVVTAATSIEFKCGGSSIKMDPQSITMKSPTINVKADIKADVSSPMTTVKGTAMLTLKGGFVFIN